MELEAEAVLDELDDVVDSMLYSFDAQHSVDVYERLQHIPKTSPPHAVVSDLDATPIGKQRIPTGDSYRRPLYHAEQQGRPAAAAATRGASAAVTTEEEEYHHEDIPARGPFLDDSPPAPASSRFDRMRTATPSDAIYHHHPSIASSGVPPSKMGLKNTTGDALRPNEENFDEDDAWVDDCLREVDHVLLDLEGGPSRGHGYEDGELGEGHQVLERMVSELQQDRTLSREQQQQRRQSAAASTGTQPPQHLQLVNRLSLWEERKEMKRMLGLYSKLVSEQAECTFHPAINPVPAYVSGGGSTSARRRSPRSARGVSVGTHSSRHGVADDYEDEDEDGAGWNHGDAYDQRSTATATAPPPRPIKGYDAFLQRMQTAREERELPQREEEDRLARYRDPTTFQRNPTTPEPFHLTATAPASSNHHLHCVPLSSSTAAAAGPSSARSTSGRSSSSFGVGGTPGMGPCSGGGGGGMTSGGSNLYTPCGSQTVPLGHRRSSSRSGSATGSSSGGASSARPSSHLIQPAVRLQAPGVSQSAAAAAAAAVGSYSQQQGDGHRQSVAPLGGGTPRSGTGHVTGIGAGQRKPKLRDIASTATTTTTTAGNSAAPRLIRRGTAAVAKGGSTTAAASASPSADLYRTLGAELRKDLFSPELSAQLQQHRCTANGAA